MPDSPSPPRRPIRRSFVPAALAAVAALLLVAAGPRPFRIEPEARLSPEQNALRARAWELFFRQSAAQNTPGHAIDELDEELLAMADSLSAAGLDSLAARATGMAALVDLRLNRIDRAEQRITRAVELARKAGSRRDEGDALDLLAGVMVRTDRAERSIELLEQVLLLRGPAERRGRAIVWGNLATTYASLGRLPEAIEAADSASSIFRALNDAYGLAGTGIVRTQILLYLRRAPEALAGADSTIAQARRAGLGTQLAVALGQRSSALTALDQPGEALAALDQAVAQTRAMGDLEYDASNHLSRANLLFGLGEYAACLAVLDTVERDERVVRDALLASRVLALRATALNASGRPQEAEAVATSALARFESLREQRTSPLSQAGVFLRGGELYAALARAQLLQGRAAEAWATVERGRGTVLRRQLAAAPAEGPALLDSVRARLRSTDAALVEFNDPRLNPLEVFVVDGESLRTVSLGSPRLAADAHVALDLMAAGESDARCRPPLERLARALLERTLPLVPATTRRLHLVPPSELAGFPFESLPLPGAKDGETLGERYAVSYVPSAAALLALRTRETAGAGLVVFADPAPAGTADGSPATTGTRGRAFDPLPHARDEARRVGGRSASVFVGAAAAKERLHEAVANPAGGPAVLHFATHALSNPARPEKSALLLAGADGWMNAAEVESLRIKSDLVTLSGCRTGGGFTYLGEGTFGLARSFLVAGARSVVTTLWDVDDRAASRFMEQFYGGLRAGLERDESLRRARVRMARDGVPHRDRSAFVLLGVGDLPVAAVAGSPGTGLPAWGIVALALGSIALVVAVAAARRRSAGRR